MGLIEKEEDYTNKVGYSERTDVAIEPEAIHAMVSLHAKVGRAGIGSRMSDKYSYTPQSSRTLISPLMENIKDWVHQPSAMVGASNSGLLPA